MDGCAVDGAFYGHGDKQKAGPDQRRAAGAAFSERGRKARRLSSGHGSLLISAAALGLIFAVWAICSAFGICSNSSVPSIQSVGAALESLAVDGYKGSTLLQHLGASFYRLGVAFLLAIVTAIPLGLISGYNIFLRAVLDPVVEFVRPLPPLAYYTLLVLWMGIGNGSKIMLLYLACFAPIYISCVDAVKKIPSSYINTAKILGARSDRVFFTVILPYAAPDIFTGVRTAIGHGYSTLVAAEMVAAVSGIGWMVLDSSNWLRTDVTFAGIIILGVTAIVINAVLNLLENKLLPYRKQL